MFSNIYEAKEETCKDGDYDLFGMKWMGAGPICYVSDKEEFNRGQCKKVVKIFG